jgi:hypothetical protein
MADDHTQTARSWVHGEFVEARPIPMDEVAEHIGDTP